MRTSVRTCVFHWCGIQIEQGTRRCSSCVVETASVSKAAEVFNGVVVAAARVVPCVNGRNFATRCVVRVPEENYYELACTQERRRLCVCSRDWRMVRAGSSMVSEMTSLGAHKSTTKNSFQSFEMQAPSRAGSDREARSNVLC